MRAQVVWLLVAYASGLPLRVSSLRFRVFRVYRGSLRV